MFQEVTTYASHNSLLTLCALGLVLLTEVVNADFQCNRVIKISCDNNAADQVKCVMACKKKFGILGGAAGVCVLLSVGACPGIVGNVCLCL